MSRLLDAMREWWYGNLPGPFDIGGGPFTVDRADVLAYGGPAPDLDGCEVCQWDEWRSRLIQAPLYTERHECPLAARRLERCLRQGDDGWQNYHQDHFFAVAPPEGERVAPHAALLLQDCASQYEWFWKRNCSAGLASFRQKLAYTGTCDPEARMSSADWRNYDWCWLVNKGEIALGPAPEAPMALYCHDAWRGNKQQVLDHYKPRVIFTPFPTLWWEQFRIPDECEVVFTPAMQSAFFGRPNLVESEKWWDLLVIGALGSDFYAPRRELNEQLKSLPERFRVEHSHEVGSHRARWMGPIDAPRPTGGEKHCYMSRWMEKLGRARFVIFGPCAGAAAPMVLIKFYECLASGAVPIMPQLADLDLVGVKPMVHYIPFDPTGVDMKALEYVLDHYAEYRYVAENAVAWWEENAHELVFGTFERMVWTLTGEQYPARVI